MVIIIIVQSIYGMAGYLFFMQKNIVPNLKKLGYATAWLVLKTKSIARHQLHAFFVEHPSINHVHRLAQNEYDFIIEIVGKTEKEILQFLKKMQETSGVVKVMYLPVAQEITRETFTPKTP